MSEQIKIPETELPPTEVVSDRVEQGPAEELGLVNGDFPVRRTDGSTDTGWEVQKYQEVIDPNTNLPETALFVTKPNPDNPQEVMQKVVRFSEVLADYQDQREKHGVERAHEVGDLVASSLVEVSTDNTEMRRKQQLFEPYAPVKHTIESSNYDHLFADIQDTVDGQASIERAAVRETTGRGVSTQDSEKYTQEVVLKRFGDQGDLRNSEISKIIGRHLEAGVSIDSQQAMLEVRNNAKLRLELGEYFLNSQAIYEDIMPVRIKENKQKVPGINGYSQLGRLKSREYVALLTLARLDGTFDKDVSNSEQIILGQDGIAIEGQHRFASDSILFSGL
jgi:hypothetical protein